MMSNSEFTFEKLHAEDSKYVIFRGVWGSHAYGTATHESDQDMIGVFIVEPKHYLTLGDTISQVADAKNDIRYYSLRNYCDLAANANPNMLDSLFLPDDCILSSTPCWQMLIEKRSLFLSKLAANSYCEYAMSQIKKARGLNKRINNPQPQALPSPEDFCYFLPQIAHGMPGRPIPLRKTLINLMHCRVAAVEHTTELFRLYDYGTESKGVFRNGNLCFESIPIGDEKTYFIGFLLFNRHAFEQAKVKHRQYWDWIENRNEAKWKAEEVGDLDYNSKHMMHTFRLLYSGLNIMKHGEPLVRVTPELRDRLLAIRSGKFDYDILVKEAEELASELQDLKAQSSLPERADINAINTVLLEITHFWEVEHA